MSLRFRQTFTLFPGVRINLGKRGVSTSIGVPGATMNVGTRGVRATVGAPGTGLSYSADLVKFGKGSGAGGVTPPPVPSGNDPASAPVYMPQEDMNEIASASVEVLTSDSLLPLRDLILKARFQQSEVEQDLKAARREEEAQSQELTKRTRSLFRWFYKRRIAELEEALPITRAEVERLLEWKENTKISVEFEAGDAAQKAYAGVVRAFDVLAASRAKWDVTADRATNQVRERTLANRSVNRYPVTLEFTSSDLIQFEGRAMRFQNVNGDDIILYPGVALMPREDGAFALIDLRELEVEAETMGFQEEEKVPADAEIITQTWAKTNKDGSPDRRFRDNYQIPVCAYGRLSFRSSTGVTEEYMISNAKAAEAFAVSVKSYQKALSEAE